MYETREDKEILGVLGRLMGILANNAANQRFTKAANLREEKAIQELAMLIMGRKLEAEEIQSLY